MPRLAAHRFVNPSAQGCEVRAALAVQAGPAFCHSALSYRGKPSPPESLSPDSIVQCFNQWYGIEDVSEGRVRPAMKTKHLFGLIAVVATVGLARSAQAGVSISFNLGLPVPVFHTSRAVAVVTPPCPPPVPVVVCKPVPRCEPVVVYRPVAPCRPVVVVPRYDRCDDRRDHRGYDHHRNGREERGYGPGGRGSDRGGRR